MNIKVIANVNLNNFAFIQWVSVSTKNAQTSNKIIHLKLGKYSRLIARLHL